MTPERMLTWASIAFCALVAHGVITGTANPYIYAYIGGCLAFCAWGLDD